MRGDGSHDRRLPRTAIAIVVAWPVLGLLAPVLPEVGEDCYDAPCTSMTQLVLVLLIGLGLWVVWVLALAWLIIAFVRKRR
jgi:hypothetical protein